MYILTWKFMDLRNVLGKFQALVSHLSLRKVVQLTGIKIKKKILFVPTSF